MNELKRLAYLQAMGVDAYCSLQQLPGAAVTRRLAIVQKHPSRFDSATPANLTESSSSRAPAPPASMAMPRVVTAAGVATQAETKLRPGASEAPLRFSLATIFCGGWLWLEELEQRPLAAQQLQLVEAMAAALGLVSQGAGTHGHVAPRPEVTQFDWPIHTNRQLDLGEEAARASAAGFIQRKLGQPDCRGLVLLGRSCEGRVALDQLECARLARTVSTSAMLAEPLLKKQAWRDLRSFFRQA